MTHLRWIFSVVAFPSVMIAALAAAIAIMDRGVEPSLAIAGPLLGSVLFIAVFERVFPFRESWNRSRGDVGVDLAFGVTDGLVERSIQIFLAPTAVAVGGWLSTHVQTWIWPTPWPLVVQLVIALVFAELFKYWGHRFMHEWEWLWRFHAVHHSVPRLYWLNASRFHPIDIGIDTALGVLPLVVIGCTQEVIALFILVTAVHGIFQHCNIELRLGPLNWFFSMAELHRWHHSRDVSEANHNYGNNLIVWDLLFGTFFLPKDRQPPEDIGLADLPAFPRTFAGQMLVPLRWRRIKSARG
ncbi:MAG: sterol desaturase family protein [Candidatus Binatia bacterium]